MKPLRVLLLLALLVVGLLAWRSLPGLRTRVESAVEEVGGWTPEARRRDPVGFLTYAEERLARDVEAFGEARRKLEEVRRQALDEIVHNGELIAGADELGAGYREAFRAAEAGGSWPVEHRGARYTREQFIEQVEGILDERATAVAVRATYEDVVRAAEARDAELKGRIASTRATLKQLAAQKELVRVERLTASTDALLAQVDELLGGNRSSLSPEADPVRSLEELVAGAATPPTPAPGARAIAYLGEH